MIGDYRGTQPSSRPRPFHQVPLVASWAGLALGILTGTVAHASSGMWSATADMLLPGGSTATLLGDGRVLVVRGLDYSEPFVTNSETYDPIAHAWTRQADLINRRNSEFLTATLLPNGRVLVAGGDAYDGFQTAELFDPAGNGWSLTGTLNVPRRRAAAVALLDGRVLLAGGVEVAGVNPVRDVEIYDPASGSWTVTGSLVVARAGFGMITFQNGTVLVVGGDGFTTSWELYDPASGVWTLAGATTDPLASGPLTLLPDGRVLSVSLVHRTAFLYDPASNTWVQTTGPQFRHDLGTATVLQDGTVLVTAGDAPTCCEPGAEVFDPATETWQATGFMLQRPRQFHTATLLSDGTVLVAGGSYEGPPCDEGSCTLYVLSSAEIFTPDGGS